MIQISQAAAKEIKRLQLSREQTDSYLYLTVIAGGCSGLSYHIELKQLTSDGHLADKKEYEHLERSNGIYFVVDESAYPLINNLLLDYSEDLMGGGFRFHNPTAVNTCSCGQSFSVTTSD